MTDTVQHSVGLPGYLRRSGYLHGMLILVVLVSGVMAWGWLMQVTVEKIDVRGTVNSLPDEIRSLADVDTGDVLFDIRPAQVVDRLMKHPWLETASATRLPTGKLILSVRERSPIVLTLDVNGRPGFYLDREGHQMKPSAAMTYDVPLLTGYPEAYHPESPTEDTVIMAFLEALAEETWDTGILLSEVVFRQNEVWLQLEPTGRHDSTPVRLGRGDFHNKFKRLAAFWNQRMVSRQDRTFELIDLRFSSQIIAREHERK